MNYRHWIPALRWISALLAGIGSLHLQKCVAYVRGPALTPHLEFHLHGHALMNKTSFEAPALVIVQESWERQVAWYQDRACKEVLSLTYIVVTFSAFLETAGCKDYMLAATLALLSSDNVGVGPRNGPAQFAALGP